MVHSDYRIELNANAAPLQISVYQLAIMPSVVGASALTPGAIPSRAAPWPAWSANDRSQFANGGGGFPLDAGAVRQRPSAA